MFYTGCVAESLNTRVTRLEDLMGRLAEKQEKLDDVLVLLVEAQIKTEARFQETDQRFEETDRRFRETDAKIDKLIEAQRETDRRFRLTDERIDKLVSAIGEFVRSRTPGISPQ